MAEQSLKDKTVKGVAWSGIDNVAQFGVSFIVSIVLASKGTVNSLLKVLALELVPKEIRVNAIMSRMVRTGMTNAYGLSEEEMDAVVKGYPLGRIGELEDITNVAIISCPQILW